MSQRVRFTFTFEAEDPESLAEILRMVASALAGEAKAENELEDRATFDENQLEAGPANEPKETAVKRDFEQRLQGKRQQQAGKAPTPASQNDLRPDVQRIADARLRCRIECLDAERKGVLGRVLVFGAGGVVSLFAAPVFCSRFAWRFATKLADAAGDYVTERRDSSERTPAGHGEGDESG